MAKFSTPEELAAWHRGHVDTTEDEDLREVGRARCPWCSCKIYKSYHEPGCPVREILTKEID